jgi:hypothetical protein
MKIVEVSSEDPILHWEFVNVAGKRVLDLGCGDFGRYGSLPYMSSLEFFLSKGAEYVVGVDQNTSDINKILNTVSYKNYKTIEMSITNSLDIFDLVKNENIKILKSDIEGGEIHLFNAADEDFCSIDEYYIETHGEILHQEGIEKLKNCGYEIYCVMNLTHSGNTSKVIFAKKKN